MKFLYKNSALLDPENLENTANTLKEYTKHLRNVAETSVNKTTTIMYEHPESSISLPFDKASVVKAQEMYSKYATKKLKYIVVIGIGGSNLGAKAVYSAIKGYFDIVEPLRFPKMIFADTNDPAFIGKLLKLLQNIKADEVILNAISKSGNTTETLENTELILNKRPDLKERLVITTQKDSKMWKESLNEKIDVLEIPKVVGGRFSVFSNVGLFPLFCAKLEVYKLLKGALDAVTNTLYSKEYENEAAKSASILFLHNQNGINISDNFYFHPELEDIGKWYRQLMAESLGKNGKGITPTVTVGSTDLHSIGQLYLGGPKDKVFSFINSKGHRNNQEKVTKTIVADYNQSIKDKTPENIMDAIYEGVKLTYLKSNIPFTEILLDQINEYSLGYYMQFKMLEIMYLGKLLNVNTFNQPNVESYKTETKKILLGE